MLDIELLQLGEERIKSVLSQGLKSGDRLSGRQKRLLSLDGQPCKIVHGALINPQRFYTNSEYYEQNITGALYFGGGAIFEVLMERPWDDRCWRARVELTNKQKKRLEQRAQHSFLVVCQFELDRFMGAKVVPSVWFQQLMFPEAVWSEYRDTVVDFAGTIPIKVVPGLVGRRILPFVPTFRLPDYETQLRDLAEVRGPTLWVHGVRLPTLEDL